MKLSAFLPSLWLFTPVLVALARRGVNLTWIIAPGLAYERRESFFMLRR